jgi:hypothetical protein
LSAARSGTGHVPSSFFPLLRAWLVFAVTGARVAGAGDVTKIDADEN